MKYFISLLLLTSVQAYSAEDYTSYENILNELQQAETRTVYEAPDSSGLDSVRIHTGIGVVTSRLNLDVPKGLPDSKAMSGAEVVVGIDLFTRKWLAEGAVRAFNDEQFSSTNIKLKEFDLRLVHEIPSSRSVTFRWGLGMSSRYLTLGGALNINGRIIAREHITPATLLLIGGKAKVHKAMSLGAELSYRSRMISDTIDQSALDGSLRLMGTF